MMELTSEAMIQVALSPVFIGGLIFLVLFPMVFCPVFCEFFSTWLRCGGNPFEALARAVEVYAFGLEGCFLPYRESFKLEHKRAGGVKVVLWKKGRHGEKARIAEREEENE